MEINQTTAEKIIVGIGDFEVAQFHHVLETQSLGSCVGIALYDSFTRIGGLAHIMLPNSKQSANPSNPAKFADTGIVLTLKEMERRGAKRKLVIAKIAGGASMFSGVIAEPSMAIGAKNVEAVKTQLRILQISLRAEDTGGNWGRTMQFLLDSGKVLIKSALKGTKEI